MTADRWKWCATSVRGFSHAEAEMPCQDAYAVRISQTGCLVAIVSDGAGSAKHSAEGSQLLCDELSKFLAHRIDSTRTFSSESLNALELPHVRECVEEGIAVIRDSLVNIARQQGGSLSDFNATLVGTIANASGGAFFHIGDGAALATSSVNPRLFAISVAENGEYANETFFYTQEDWRTRLRFLEFDGNHDLLVLMTDGVTPVALAKGGAAPFIPFLDPVTKFLSECDTDIGQAGLIELLQRDALRAISGDDKTIVWAKRISG